MAYRNIPLYTQLTNTCGLSSLLMIARPEDDSLAVLLTDVMNRMRVEPYYQGSIGWQLAEAYLLMKFCFNRTLKYYLRKRFGDEYYYFRAILFQQLEDRKNTMLALNNRKAVSAIQLFLRRGIVQKAALYEYLFEMKTNLELKMLAYFFGGEQVLYPSPDGTGCIYLDGTDNKKKLQILYQQVPDGILIGLGYHWLAVQGMEEIKKNKYKIIYHDPKGLKKAVSSDKIEKHFRFYMFKFDMEKRRQRDSIVRRALKLALRR
ncbi:MAG: hypothetical protein ACTSRC_15695 [Candidatus Helarchaeota archaeon]